MNLKKLNDWLTAHPIIRKPLNTFWQSFSSVLLLGIFGVFDTVVNKGVDAGKTALIALLVAAGASALSAVKTYFVEASKESK